MSVAKIIRCTLSLQSIHVCYVLPDSARSVSRKNENRTKDKTKMSRKQVDTSLLVLIHFGTLRSKYSSVQLCQCVLLVGWCQGVLLLQVLIARNGAATMCWATSLGLECKHQASVSQLWDYFRCALKYPIWLNLSIKKKKKKYSCENWVYFKTF